MILLYITQTTGASISILFTGKKQQEQFWITSGGEIGGFVLESHKYRCNVTAGLVK